MEYRVTAYQTLLSDLDNLNEFYIGSPHLTDFLTVISEMRRGLHQLKWITIAIYQDLGRNLIASGPGTKDLYKRMDRGIYALKVFLFSRPSDTEWHQKFYTVRKEFANAIVQLLIHENKVYNYKVHQLQSLSQFEKWAIREMKPIVYAEVKEWSKMDPPPR
ncbi:PREDICTED: uncharacterized protein LOC104735222 [Camelina sativa]|uniref:Uncharacterized protein LOC104735222 n=1 Tax=Camelina sativa TaxID=90675 RepID=A0ABM0VAA7_CAMSA|nr:PREDICTED: uncharacterized protein LOC104735222 [Camelina sativa]